MKFYYIFGIIIIFFFHTSNAARLSSASLPSLPLSTVSSNDDLYEKKDKNYLDQSKLNKLDQQNQGMQNYNNMQNFFQKNTQNGDINDLLEITDKYTKLMNQKADYKRFVTATNTYLELLALKRQNIQRTQNQYKAIDDAFKAVKAYMEKDILEVFDKNNKQKTEQGYMAEFIKNSGSEIVALYNLLANKNKWKSIEGGGGRYRRYRSQNSYRQKQNFKKRRNSYGQQDYRRQQRYGEDQDFEPQNYERQNFRKQKYGGQQDYRRQQRYGEDQDFAPQNYERQNFRRQSSGGQQDYERQQRFGGDQDFSQQNYGGDRFRNNYQDDDQGDTYNNNYYY